MRPCATQQARPLPPPLPRKPEDVHGARLDAPPSKAPGGQECRDRYGVWSAQLCRAGSALLLGEVELAVARDDRQPAGWGGASRASGGTTGALGLGAVMSRGLVMAVHCNRHSNIPHRPAWHRVSNVRLGSMWGGLLLLPGGRQAGGSASSQRHCHMHEVPAASHTGGWQRLACRLRSAAAGPARRPHSSRAASAPAGDGPAARAALLRVPGHAAGVQDGRGGAPPRPHSGRRRGGARLLRRHRLCSAALLPLRPAQPAHRPAGAAQGACRGVWVPCTPLQAGGWGVWAPGLCRRAVPRSPTTHAHSGSRFSRSLCPRRLPLR